MKNAVRIFSGYSSACARRAAAVRIMCIVLLIAMAPWTQVPVFGDEAERPFPARMGFSASFGHIYDPRDDREQLALFTGFVEIDHDYAAFFDTPDYLRFKLEATVGSGLRSPWKGMVSVNMLSLCFIDRLATEAVRPYVEGGIGVVYSGYRWDGQASNLLHNPVAGAGVQISPDGGGPSQQFALRLYHASNGGLHRKNKAMNAVLFSAGVLF